MDRDGTKQGYDVELTAAVAAAVGIPVVASGGAGTPDHFYEALTAGRADVVGGSARGTGRGAIGVSRTLVTSGSTTVIVPVMVCAGSKTAVASSVTSVTRVQRTWCI